MPSVRRPPTRFGPAAERPQPNLQLQARGAVAPPPTRFGPAAERPQPSLQLQARGAVAPPPTRFGPATVHQATDRSRTKFPTTVIPEKRRTNFLQRGAAAGNQPIVQLMKAAKAGRQSKKVNYARTDKEAIKWLTDNTKFDSCLEVEKETAIKLAMDPKQGFAEAKNVLDSIEIQKTASQRRNERQNSIKEDEDNLTGTYTSNLANSVVEHWVRNWIALNHNPTVGDQWSQDEVDEAIDELGGESGHDLEGAEKIKNVHCFRRQDKAAEGKSNVGDTLDTRGLQANFIATVCGFQVNVHVNISSD